METKYKFQTRSDSVPYTHPLAPEKVEEWMSRKEVEYLQALSKDKIYLEIGTYDGFTAFMMSLVAKKVIAIDPFISGTSRLHNYFHRIQRNKYDKVVTIVNYSQNVAEILKPNFVDVLLIDGNHYVDSVRSDYELYRPLVKPNGYIAFHGYGVKPFEVANIVDTIVKDEFVECVETLCVFKRGENND
jgi:predicted O-methyltransferase YrrM